MVKIKLPDEQTSHDIMQIHEQYKKIIEDMQKSYESEFDTLKEFIIKQNKRQKQTIENQQKTMMQKIQENERVLKQALLENQQLKGIIKKKDSDIKDLKQEVLTMDKQLKEIGGGRHGERLELPAPSKKSSRIKELEALSLNAIIRTQDSRGRREENTPSNSGRGQKSSRIDQILEDAWSKYQLRKKVQEEEGYLRSSSANSRSMSFSEKKKQEHHFENRDGLKDWEQRWRKSLRKVLSPNESEKSKEGLVRSPESISNRKAQKHESLKAQPSKNYPQSSNKGGYVEPKVHEEDLSFGTRNAVKAASPLSLGDSKSELQGLIQRVELKPASETTVEPLEKNSKVKSSKLEIPKQSQAQKDCTPFDVEFVPQKFQEKEVQVLNKDHESSGIEKKSGQKDSPVRARRESPSRLDRPVLRDSSVYSDKPVNQHIAYLKDFVQKYIGNQASAGTQDNKLINLLKSPEPKPYLFSKTEVLKFEQVQGYSHIEISDPNCSMNSWVPFFRNELRKLELRGIIDTNELRFKAPTLASLVKDGVEISMHDPSQFSLKYPDGLTRSVLIQIDATSGTDKLSSFTKFNNSDYEIYTFTEEGKLAKVYHFGSRKILEIIYFDDEKTEYLFEEDGQLETIHSNGLIEILTKDCRTEFRPDNTSVNIYSSGVQETTFLDGSRLVRLKDGTEIKVNEYGQLQSKAPLMSPEAKESEIEEDFDPNGSDQDNSFDPNKTVEDEAPEDQEVKDQTGQSGNEDGQEEIEYEEVIEEEEQSQEDAQGQVKSVQSSEEEDAEEEIIYEEVTDPEAGEEEVEYEEVEVTDEDAK